MDNEIKRLIEVNNEHLRAKGRLQQEIIELKKQIIQQDKNAQLIADLREENMKLKADIEELLLAQSVSIKKAEELTRQLSVATSQQQEALAEIKRLNNLKWHQRLFRK